MAEAGQRDGLSLCVGAPAFWARASGDIAAARRRVFVQAMTFEGDAAGLAVAEAIAASPAADRRVLVDGYTEVNLNDTALSRRALRHPALAAEKASTDAMFRRLAAQGVPVRVTNRVDRPPTNYPARDHRKLVLADDVAYIGGINFSDHNYLWPDLMLRIEGAGAAAFLAAGFEATFAGRPRAARAELDGLILLTVDGRSNTEGFAPVFDLIAGARDQIDLVSPYVTEPFLSALGAARRRGVRVRLFTPLANNKPTVRNALFHVARRLHLQIVAGPVMSHLKGLLVDGAALVLGSSNLDFASLAAEAETLAIVRDQMVIADFQACVIAPALVEAVPVAMPSAVNGAAAALALRIAARVAASARTARRTTVDWGA